MFDKIQHIGYLVRDLDAAVAWYAQGFGGENAGGSTLPAGGIIPSGGRNAFVHFGKVEVELIEPQDKTGLPDDTLVMHHIGYVVSDIAASMVDLKAKGFKFFADAPITNVMGQQLIYFDPASTNGILMHLTQLPSPSSDAGRASTVGLDAGVKIDHIVHAGYLVNNLEEAIAWYVDKLGGTHLGGGPSRSGGRNAFVNFGQVQVELIEPPDPASLGPDHSMDHVGYVTLDIETAIADCRARGFQFVADTPITNSVGQRLLYFETGSTQGSRMHLTQLPA